MTGPLQLTFVTSAVDISTLPGSPAEVAVVGRSNVGKSSLINALANHKQLARVSNTPGRTQLINLFAMPNGSTLVDLPGYGYAAVPGRIKQGWQKMIEGYLLDREELVNVFVLVGGSVMLLSVGMIFLIAFTPLREYIPGYSSNEVRRDALKLDMRADSLYRQLALHNQQLRTIQKIIKGEDIDSAYSEVEDSGIVKPESDALEASVMENNLREFVETEDRFNIPTNQSALSHFSFFTPLNGVVTSSFNPKENHLAVDVVAEKNAPVKACLGGSVLLANGPAKQAMYS